MSNIIDRESHFREFTELSLFQFSSFDIDSECGPLNPPFPSNLYLMSVLSGTLKILLADVSTTQYVDTAKLEQKFNSRLPLAPSFEFKAV